MDISDKTDTKNSVKFSLLEIVGVVVGLSGLFAAIAWFFGRIHYAGYFDALEIPISEINASTNERRFKSQVQLCGQSKEVS